METDKEEDRKKMREYAARIVSNPDNNWVLIAEGSEIKMEAGNGVKGVTSTNVMINVPKATGTGYASIMVSVKNAFDKMFSVFMEKEFGMELDGKKW